jgi:hypothetical protein
MSKKRGLVNAWLAPLDVSGGYGRQVERQRPVICSVEGKSPRTGRFSFDSTGLLWYTFDMNQPPHWGVELSLWKGG